MKTYLTYGAAMTAGNTLLIFTLYFLDYHSDPAKIQTAGTISNIGAFVFGVVCIILGTRARRNEVPAHEEFGYGRALGSGVMISLFASLFGIVNSFVYFQLVNPGFTEVALRGQVMAMEAQNLSAGQIEQAQKFTRMIMQPAVLAIFGFVGTMFFCTLISLVTSAFIRRPASDIPPGLPPVVG